LSLLPDVSPARWVETHLTATADAGTVSTMVPAVFAAYARVLPPAYDDDERRHRWSEIAARTLSGFTGTPGDVA
jgi:hypothetical protein